MEEQSVKLFEGEKWLVITGIVGFILSAGIALFMFFQGSVILPEGDMSDAFSFNAALGMFILSLAAILPFARLNAQKRKTFRWLLIVASIYSYGIETIQNFRGFNPRFTREGSVVDMISGMLFGVVSILFVIVAIMLAIQFFRIKPPFERPLPILGIRYAFISILLANIVGIGMILLQGRFIGDTGNFIVLHGMGFHALQTLIVPALLMEKAQHNERIKKWLIHFGSIAWTLAIILIGFQTALGRTVFELTPLPIISFILLVIWLGTAIIATILFIKNLRRTAYKTDFISSN